MLLLIFALVFGMLMIGYDVFSFGFVLTKFYAWFIVPFFGSSLPNTMPYLVAVGLIMFLSVLRHGNTTPKYSFTLPGHYQKISLDEDPTIKWGVFFAAPWIVLFGGWILHLIIG